ncbi:MAG: zinc-ribbon domain-containing protein [Myxococcales bacterium]|nr:zinc-ribbon domain-containing protein [Myxococcales bacterium]
MIVRCSKCSTEFDLNPQQVGPEGVTLRCSVCEHMFHAEPNPDAGVHQPWQLCNTDNHLFTLPDLQTVVEWIEDGRLRPDDQLSRTGQHWLRLGDIPELSTVFVGFDGLAKVFRALDEPPPVPSVGDLGPPPAFGEGLGDIPDFGVGNAPLDSPSQSMPASMLDAVTKAVSAPPKPAADDDVPQPRKGHRSQPILVSELEAEAKAKAAAAAESESELEPESEPSAPTEVEGTPTTNVPAQSVAAAAAEGSATADAVEAAVAAQQVASMPADEAPEEKRGGLGWLAILGVAAGLAVMFGVPEIRAKILGEEAPVAGSPTAAPAKSQEALPPADLSVADQAIAKLGIDETTRAQSTLQKMIDVREQRSQPTEDIKLAQVELILTRALAFKIAVSLDPTAVSGTARSRAEQDQRWATELLASLDEAKVEDRARWERIQALVALADNQVGEAANRVPPTAGELALVVKAAPLWINSDGAVPPGLIAGLQGLPQPSGLARSLHALALWRSGDEEGAQRMVAALNQSVPDQPLAITLDHVLAEAIAADSGGADEVTDAVDDSGGGSNSGGGTKVRRPRGSGGSGGGSGEDTSDPSTLTPRGCEKVRGGDPTAGVKLLLGAIDANAMGLETYLCLGEGYMKMGNVGSSLSFYDRAVKLAPKSKAALAGAALAAEKAKRTAQAVDFYKRLLAVDPNNEAAKSFLAANGVKAGDGGSGGSGGAGASGSSGGDGAGSASGDDGDGDKDDKDDGGSPFLPVGGGS